MPSDSSTVLVSGASVAGTALAYWLIRHGFDVTVVERHPGLRPGGQAIDVRGPALKVLDRMGLLEAAAAKITAIRGMSVVDANGNEIHRNTEITGTGGVIDNSDLELLREDLVALIYSTTLDAEYLFDDTIVAIDECADKVRVSFENHPDRAFDLVIGADGVHSNVRRLAFGPEASVSKRMGQFLAICTASNFLDLDYWQMWHYDDARERFAGVYSAHNNSESRIIFGFTDKQLTLDYRDVAAQRAEIERRFADSGPFASQLLDTMRGARDFYCDEMTQIIMDTWTSDRIALIGDAAHCCSPMSGQGTSLALLDAYALAGELATTDGDHRQGFAAFETTMHDYAVNSQALAFLDSRDTQAWEEAFYPVVNAFTVNDYPLRTPE
ncbi:MAG: FAD-dependent monooxygenase [Mycobacteriaceae bacterium]|nr:FAD-dependent monooxygenase [Mycobacteriaceae bacterium]